MPSAAQPSENTSQAPHGSSVDPEEIARFSALADTWWDQNGPMKPLHRMNPVRIEYIKTHTGLSPKDTRNDATASSRSGGVKPKAEGAEPPVRASEPNNNSRNDATASSRSGGAESRSERGLSPLSAQSADKKEQPISLLDIGCGGGLISEPMARLGARVTAIDASEKNIRVATLHAERSGLAIDYRATTAESLAATAERFDTILALEIIEHVADVDAFLDALHTLLKPGGTLILSTLNRTPKSYLFAIIGAEYVLRLLPRGTHSWRKFIRPSELARALRARNLNIADTSGMTMHPLNGSWALTQDLDINYLMTSTKPL